MISTKDVLDTFTDTILFTTGGKPAELGKDGRLKCPECGQADLCHADVRVIDRKYRDYHEGTMTVVTGDKVKQQIVPSRSLPGSYSFIDISLFCKWCHKFPEYILRIAQHNGQTFIVWRY